jgi:3-oxoacyl-[acyl-carrier protein] reductase
MLLEGTNAIVFAATGAIGSAVAREFGAAGAALFVSGRSAEAVAELREALEAAGLRAEGAVVDATDEEAVTAWVSRVLGVAGHLDVAFNAIGLRAAEGAYATPATDLSLADFLRPMGVIVASQFLTARAVAPHMVARGSGSIVTLSASLSGLPVPYMAGLTAACGAVEAMTRSLAGEFGPAGVRVNCVRAGGMPETRTIEETTSRMRAALGLPEHAQPPGFDNAMGRPVTVTETARTVALLGSTATSGMTGQVVNVCGGQLIG